MKKKNEGFTLVELVIAIVILAIAVSPLLANFIQSSKMNLKSRKQLNALNLAQDIMEGMSQYTAQDNAEYLFVASVSNNSILEDKRILPSGTTLSGCSGKVTTKSNPTMTAVAAPMPKDWTKFEYTISGVQTASGNYNNYDMTVTIDSTAITTNVDAGGKTPAEVANAINGKEYANISQVDRYFDVVDTIKAAEEELAYSELRKHSANPATPIANFSGKVSRTISINFVNNGDDAHADYSVEVINTYKVLNQGDNMTSLGFTGVHADEASTTYVERSGNLSKADKSIMPRSIYLYYEGLSGATKTNHNEKIEINNTTNQPVIVYLIRTVDADKLTDPGVISFNSSYGCDVYVNSKASAAPGAASVDNVEIVSNLRYDLLSDSNKRVYKEGTMELLPGVSSSDVSASHYDRDRSKIYYNSATAIGDTATQDNVFYENHVSDGYRRMTKDVLYDVKIEIRESGKTNVIATYTGGLSN